MPGQPPNPPSAPMKAVFLSYASEDAEAAARIADALKAAGIEVWFDRNALRGGDEWDHKIRREIRECALFVPLVSANSEARHEGYFRLEWDLADQRSHRIVRGRPFIVPIALDDTPESAAGVPESFLRVQWTRLPGGQTPPAFAERVQRLLSGEESVRSVATASAAAASGPGGGPPSAGGSKRLVPLTAAVIALGALAYLVVQKPWSARPAPSTASTVPVTAAPNAPSAPATAFNPPPHSIAVLPFVNLSRDKDQEYFSDGLTEELLNSLTEIHELQVAARTSAFYFKGKDSDLSTIARKLNVGAILEGSVRRSGNTIRVTTQLINAVTGFDLWSKSYDRDLGDTLKLQTEIATAVAEALKVTLLGDLAQRIELGGTRNPAAFDAYLRASKAFYSFVDAATDLPPAIAAYTRAIDLDPNYALAFAGRSMALTSYAAETGSRAATHEYYEKAERDARSALTLAPDLAEAHLALANLLQNGTLDFARANDEYARALALAPGNAQTLRWSGRFDAWMGHFEDGIAAARRAVRLDPLNDPSYLDLGVALYAARQFAEAAVAFSQAISVNPHFKGSYGLRGLALYGLGDLEHARASCETNSDWLGQECLAVVYQKQGKPTEALATLTKLRASAGDGMAYQYAAIYAQWGDRTTALAWLDTAMRLRDPGLSSLKTDPLMDPLRNEPRFQAVLRELKFPE